MKLQIQTGAVQPGAKAGDQIGAVKTLELPDGREIRWKIVVKERVTVAGNLTNHHLYEAAVLA